MKRMFVAAAAASFLLASCYTVRTSAPPGTAATFAASGEPCAPIMHKRVHYLFAGLVNVNSNEVTVPGNARVRVVTETDVLDLFLRALGAVFTFGIYGGTQSATVEMCQQPMVAGAPGAPIVMPAPEPAPTIVIDAGVMARRAGGSGNDKKRPARDSNQTMCEWQSDCEFGSSCNDRGDGIKVCMGDGGEGDFCAWESDCVFELSCREGGDGYKRCM